MEIFNAIVDGMTWLLNWLYYITETVGIPNYGIAIILLTIIIKMVLYPLSHKQMKSMLAMQQIQPKIKEIQQKYKEKDPKKMQQKMMDLYREHNVNPAAGMDNLNHQVALLSSDIGEIKTKTDQLESKVAKLEDKLDSIAEKQNQQSEVINVLASRSIYQEAEIQAIKRVK